MVQRFVQRKKTDNWLCFLAAFMVLLVALWLTPDRDVDGPNVQNFGELVAYHLTRIGFVLLISASVLVLVIPALQKLGRGIKESSIWWAPLAFLLNLSVEKIGKTFLDMPRPDSLQNGFPSGHSMASFLMAWLISTKYPKLAPFWYAFAVAISWSRVQVHAHFPYQVVSAALIGTLLGWLITRVIPDRQTVSKIEKVAA